jgi:hypothetical protein
MDLFDFFPVSGPEGLGPRRKLTPDENIASFLVMIGLPLVDFCLVMFAGLAKHPGLAIVWLPVVLVALGALICRRLRVGTGQAVMLLLGCGFWCFIVSLCVVAMESFILPW